jgi:NAD+ synthase
MTKDKIVEWIKDYATKYDKTSLVVGVSGGIDSSVVSALCAETGLTTIPVILSINMEGTNGTSNQNKEDLLAHEQMSWLEDNYTNIEGMTMNMNNIFRRFMVFANQLGANSELGFVNSRSRMRMAMLYQIAQSNNGLVIGTGNKVEDFGVGFFTKWGDGGVDISPIGDLYKSDVYQLAASLGILKSIFSAAPTDGLWDDGRTDEDQLGLTYDQLEDAMKRGVRSEHYERYNELRTANLHKMEPIPVFLTKQ